RHTSFSRDWSSDVCSSDLTHTNIEGRISVVNQKVTAPGTARPDWMIAAELAFRLGADLQLTSVDDIWDEISEISVRHQGITVEQLANETDGIVLRPAANVGQHPTGEPLSEETVVDEPEADGSEAETVADVDAQDHAVAADAADTVAEADAAEAAATE